SVNKVSISHLLLKTVDQEIPYYGGLNKNAVLQKVFCIPEDCLLLITVYEPYQGHMGKVYKTEWLPEQNLLNLPGKEISIRKNKLEYKVLPKNLDEKLPRLTNKGSSGFCPRNNSFYRKEWIFLDKYYKTLQDLEKINLEPEI